MSAAIVLVARREMLQRFRGKAWYVATAIAVIAVLAVGLVARFVTLDDEEQAEVGVTADAPAGLADALDAAGDAANYEIELRTYEDGAALRSAVEAGEVDVGLAASDGGATAVYPGEVDGALQPVLQQAWAAANLEAGLAAAGLDPAEVTDLLGAGALTATSTDTAEADAGEDLSRVVGMFSSIALFIAVQMYGSYILMGVVEEKSTAVVEVLLARVRATTLLVGKVIGIGLVALAQLAIIVACAVTALAISGAHIPSSLWTAMPSMLIWFLGGFGMYSFLYAMAGAMVSRQEDAQAAATPVTMLLMAVYLSVFIFAFDPSLTVARVLSMIPPFTPLIMPLRVASGDAAIVEVVVAVAGMALMTALVAIYAGRIYTNLVLRRGARIGWSEALRSTGG